MKSLRIALGTLVAAISLLTGSAIPAAAVQNNNGTIPTPYVAAFAPAFGAYGVPRTGLMRLVVEGGTISGTYSGTSVGPDVLDDRIVPVVGTVSDGDRYVQLFIGGAITLRGTMAPDGSISGTATEGRRIYEFAAAPQSGR